MIFPQISLIFAEKILKSALICVICGRFPANLLKSKMNKKYVDIGINLTNKQFRGEIETIINNAAEAGVEQLLLTETNVENSLWSGVIFIGKIIKFRFIVTKSLSVVY